MTTIITKNGNGQPSSLEVGELAIDKSEPALYTNTGGSIQKIGGDKSGGGSVPVVTSWPNYSSKDWRNPWNCTLQLKYTTDLTDMINLSNKSGYLLALEIVKRTSSTQSIRCRITVDGKVIKDMTGSTAGDNIVIVFWPPAPNAPARSTTANAGGMVTPSFPLRFESSLRVQFSSADANGISIAGQYVLT